MRSTRSIVAGLLLGFCFLSDNSISGQTIPPAERPIDTPCKEIDDSIYQIAIPDWSPILGDRENALVTIVVFSEFQCPFCARLAQTLEQIHARFGSQVRIVFRHNPLPFHKNAFLAAKASMAADRQGRFIQMHDLLFQHRQELSQDSLFGYASTLGLDMQRFAEDFRSQVIQDWIEHDMAEAKRMGARGVPTSYINGQLISGAQPLARFVQKIEQALPKARQIGLKGDALYQQLVACGLRPNPAVNRPAHKDESRLNGSSQKPSGTKRK